ncbi:VIP peptide [Merluccius polli]|uniref:VIP peptide n=1 Tax=Merluccius polli TaxID=89951 RepID=A0AA47MSM0_MERPO|nr:VIP peptide [Merluccius polli]
MGARRRWEARSSRHLPSSSPLAAKQLSATRSSHRSAAPAEAGRKPIGRMYRLNLLVLLAASVPGVASLPLAAFSSRSGSLEANNGDWNHRAQQDLELLYDLTRSTRHADGLFTSGYSKLLGQLSAKDYLESLIAKRVNGDVVKRHSDAVFTDNYSRFRKQMAAKKYLNSVLSGKRSLDDIGQTELSIRTDSVPSQSGSDLSLEDVLNHLTLTLAHLKERRHLAHHQKEQRHLALHQKEQRHLAHHQKEQRHLAPHQKEQRHLALHQKEQRHLAHHQKEQRHLAHHQKEQRPLAHPRRSRDCSSPPLGAETASSPPEGAETASSPQKEQRPLCSTLL